MTGPTHSTCLPRLWVSPVASPLLSAQLLHPLLPDAPSASLQLSQGWAVIAQPPSLATFRAPDLSAHPISLCLSIQLLRTTVWSAFLNQALWKDADFLGLIWTGEGLGAGWGL